MPTHRDRLPQLDAELFLTDGGIETTLIFDDGLDLPDFAAFTLVDQPAGREALVGYFDRYAEIARRDEVGIVLETATWRASADWGARLGYPQEALDRVNADSVAMLEELRARHQTDRTPVVISGCVGPRGDGYDPGVMMTADEASGYHARQIATLAESGVDLVTAITMTYMEEAIGITRAAQDAEVPVVISFTVETDGNLPTGQSLGAAIASVDEETSGYPAYYMINCAHPTHFERQLDTDQPWTGRLRGIRANASRMSHEELDNAEELDRGDPQELADEYARLRDRNPQLTVLGGCCGTSHLHVDAISTACGRVLTRETR